MHTGYAMGPTTTTITDCIFTDNQAVGGGGSRGTAFAGAVNQEIPVPGFTGPSTLIVSRCSFNNNKALGNGVGGEAFGGAVYNNYTAAHK